MPRAGAPPWKQRKEPILDEYVRASVNAANGVHNEQGHYATLVYAGVTDYDRAKEIKQALYRAAKYVGVSMSANITKQPDGTYAVDFKAIDKTLARKYVLEKYGTDRSKWAYDPRAKNPKKANSV